MSLHNVAVYGFVGFVALALCTAVAVTLWAFVLEVWDARRWRPSWDGLRTGLLALGMTVGEMALAALFLIGCGLVLRFLLNLEVWPVP